ncbi:MAG: hypothetical protein WAW02_09175 [Sideroxyarcus sp.]
MKRRVFFVGAGFSKALCAAYPTLDELSTNLSTRFLARYPDGAIREHYNRLPQGLVGNAEQLLSYLYSDWPWKSSIDKDLDRALYKALTYEISESLRSIQTLPLSAEYQQFVRFLGNENNKIITLNYDSLIQELYRHYAYFKVENYCGIDIHVEDDFDEEEQRTTPANPWLIESDAPTKRKLRIRRDLISQITPSEFTELFRSLGAYWTHLSPDSILGKYQIKESPYSGGNIDGRVLKLHGSIDWYEDYSDDTIRVAHSNGETKWERVPIIVPPVLDKSQHYSISKIRKQWVDAHLALEQADEIVIIGFSFPATDISCQFLFKSSLKSKKVRVVVINRDANVRQQYDSVFSGLTGIGVDYSYMGYDDSLNRYIENEILRRAR